MSPTWETATDWDAPQSETGVHHEQPTGTDWSGAGVVEKGYATYFPELSGNVLAYYPLAEGSGATTANDVSGTTTYDGAYTGTTVSSGGPFGKRYRSFDQTDDYIDTGHNFSPASNMSVSAWFRINGWNTSFENIFNNWDGNNNSVSLQRDSGNNALTSSADGTSVTGGGAGIDPDDGAWHFVTAAWDFSQSSAQLYLDSLQDGNGTGGTVDSTVGTVHWIGAEPDTGSGANWFGGDIAHVIVTDHSMSQSEHTALYEAAL